ncbi:uncharacterized protein BX663DRAFT_506124 [Cokeromyces recurvatus]|uniref:uncharacterized protein n=1 Tax=Cokeromyces recurvatus TaxID=90255 RepID=UPI0022203ED0|nr:uncharacterized protein BX663DRAFT_506124 [Cokeromyces recurvatus]KAI7904017.1 hypothetical protein BX663DRAFT_506124 [Cokeromyces recurvatus]
MTFKQQSTVIFIQSTAHWEAIQRQKAQLLGIKPSSEPERPQTSSVNVNKKPTSKEKDTSSRRSQWIGKEGSRRRQRWLNNNFLNHPSAVLYAEDLRPPGYNNQDYDKYELDVAASVLCSTDDDNLLFDGEGLEDNNVLLPHALSRNVRYNLKKTHVSKILVSNYESQLMQFINLWLDDLKCLDKAYLEIKVVSNNQFERYILHTMCRYYGLYSFSKTDEQNNRITYICHPAYINYVTKQDVESIDYIDAANWTMPEKSFYEYLFNQKNV